ncbi:MAG: low temperature requirement protein A [Saprospiraceae bacterium]|nr:low temperature requirement protein A [Saprospiraceae bacterium]
MRNVPIPSREEDFTADPAELFFDLSFVFAFSRLVFHLVHDPTLAGIGEFVLLFALIWIAWSNFTWAANAVAGNSRFVRTVFMVATAISLPMAASLEAPFGSGSIVFAVTVSAILTMPIITGAALLDDEAVRSSNRRYLFFTVGAIVLVLAGGFASGAVQIGLWIAALAVLVLNTIDAGGGDWMMRPGHFAERHGLIVIIALGEVVVAIGAPVVETLSEGHSLDANLVAALTASGVLAGLLWWSYFDRPLPALERRHEGLTDPKVRALFARDVYTYNHFFIVGAILVAAAALEEIMLHPADPLPTPFRWMLFIGISAYLLGVVLSVLRAYSALALERLVAVAALGVLIAVSPSLSGMWLLIAVDLLLLLVLIIEHYRVEVARRYVLVQSKSQSAETQDDSRDTDQHTSEAGNAHPRE